MGCPNRGENYEFGVAASNDDTKTTYCTVCDEEVERRFTDGDAYEPSVMP